MSESARWIIHEGVKILYANSSGLNEGQLLDLIDVVANMRQKSVDAEDPYHLSLINLEGMVATRAIASKSRHSNLTKHTDKTSVDIVGLTRAKKVILGMVAPAAQYFSSEDDALAWLVAEARKKTLTP